MHSEKLMPSQQHRTEYGAVDAKIPMPCEIFHVNDECFDSMSWHVADILFSETDESFEKGLHELGSCPGSVSLGEEVVDPLGIYSPADCLVKIDENKIHRCTVNMRNQGCSIDYQHLSKVVEIHENQHALHHLAGDSRQNGATWTEFRDCPSFILEILAQLFTFYEVSSDTILKNAFIELEKRQDTVYHLWRLFRQCDKERFYWSIRDNYIHVDRMVRIFQKIGVHQISYYQVAAGSFARNYGELFLKFGMAFVGWGKDFNLMKELRVGDRLILKQGTKKIKAVGIVCCRDGKCFGDHYEDSDQGRDQNKDRGKNWLDDFDGWDLPHYCYVRWHEPEEQDCDVKQGKFTRSTFQRINQDTLKDKAEKILKTYPVIHHSPEPEPTTKLDDNEILNFLISEGLRASSGEDFVNNLRRIRFLVSYYATKCDWSKISEDETRTFLVVPLLLALGWSEQQIKLEHKCRNGSIDLAVFNAPYKMLVDDNSKSTPNDRCVLIIETKRFDQGLDYAIDQVIAYAEKEFDECWTVVTTNGWCYKTYARNKITREFERQPSAYLNILCPTDQYPLDPQKGGAKEVFKRLLRR